MQALTATATCPSTASSDSATVTISSNDPDEANKTVTVNLNCTTPGTSNYDIDLRFVTSVTPSQQTIFEDAAARWSQIVIGDLPDVMVNKPANACGVGDPAINELVDDVLIQVFVASIDGANGVLAQAGPCWIRTTGSLPLQGVMVFDSADIDNLETSGSLGDTVLHEMGHVLGIGILWDNLGLLNFTPDATGVSCVNSTNNPNPNFSGTMAVTEYASLGGSGNVPVEDEFGAGTKCSHWDEGVFDTEVMTGFIDIGSSNPLSRMTAASLGDLGYTVNANAADAYSIPTCSPICTTAINGQFQLKEILISPRATVDPQGQITPLDDYNP